MDTRPPADDAFRPRFRAPFPIFSVRDLPRSIAFFREALGFEPGYRWPADGPLDEVAFIVLTLGGHSVGLGRNPSDVQPPAIDEPLEQLHVQFCLEVDDIHGALGLGAGPWCPGGDAATHGAMERVVGVPR